ncbi:MAG: hypothetical protein GXO07_05955 [Crenarchaeota archaeon]|nr:hypothetical protein [Thermoproteota archaeon]
MDEKEAIKISINAEVVEVKEVGNLYVVKARGCGPEDVRLAKRYLRKMGFWGLAKRVVFECL